MKFITAILVAAVAAVASAQKIQFNNPTTVTKWTAGKTVFVGWTGNCANSGAAGKNTTVNIVFGDPSAVQFKAILGLIDCTGSLVRADLTVPADIEPGTYSLEAKTSPISYSPAFTILGADGTGPAPSTSASTPAPGTTDAPKSAGTSLTASSAMLAVAGVVAAALTL
ncbi:hypothetical protein BGZ52_007084 [Haplosporangium bisporale]|nr:hypothetical protein BGZ52_007084 [Haplosporangium bisporale]KAF9216646.1 hypothetical protein BGZ59_008679 [Podila verticillata]KAI9241922.1 MAG: hypothetical protein BYD32DRAFT_483685 [Podila humilis]KFH70744.1 hypothetical protein MVEG_03592 [Podila verticillata NRRL 6337]